jgi:hypothetical protein
MPPRFRSAVEAARAVVADRAEPPERRLEVLSRSGGSIVGLPGGIDTLLEIAAEPHDDPAVRRAATGLLGVAAAETDRFRPHRTAYVDLLRSLISDPVPELRHTAVTTLAAQQDEVVQQVLLDGLQGRGPLPVGRHRALELLAQQAGAQEGNHATAEDGFARILQDRTATVTARLQGATELRTLAPARFAAAAKEIALDPDDDPDVRAGCLNSLRAATDGSAVHGDPDFLEGLRTVAEEATGTELAVLARETLDEATRAREA